VWSMSKQGIDQYNQEFDEAVLRWEEYFGISNYIGLGCKEEVAGDIKGGASIYRNGAWIKTDMLIYDGKNWVKTT
jgi:hypothetical protein